MTDEEKIPNFLDQIRQLIGDPDFVFGEFRPCFVYNEPMDWLEFIYEDCTTVTEYQKGNNIAILRKWDGKEYCGIVGIKICDFSAFAPPGVVEAFKADNAKYRKKTPDDDGLCVECGRFQADPPSKLCPGCEAYQDHTR